MVRYSKLSSRLSEAIRFSKRQNKVFSDYKYLEDHLSKEADNRLVQIIFTDALHQLSNKLHLNVYLSSELFDFLSNTPISKSIHLSDLILSSLPVNYLSDLYCSKLLLPSYWASSFLKQFDYSHLSTEDVKYKACTIIFHVENCKYSMLYYCGYVDFSESLRTVIPAFTDKHASNILFRHVFCMPNRSDEDITNCRMGLAPFTALSDEPDPFFRAFVNFVYYISAFPECYKAGLPKNSSFDKVASISGKNYLLTPHKSVVQSTRSVSSVKMHFRKGHWRLLKSPHYKAARFKTLWIDAMVVNRDSEEPSI